MDFEITSMFKTIFKLINYRFTCLTIIVLVSGSTYAQNESIDGELLLANVNIVDIVQNSIRHGSILIKQGKVIAEFNRIPKTYNGKIIDLDNRWIIPGLIDLHVHAFGNRAPNSPNDNPGIERISQRALFAGVTGFLDLFGDEDTLIKARSRQRNGKYFGADIYASLSCLTAPNGHCTEYGIKTRTMENEEQAQLVVNDLATLGPDVVKIVYQPSDDQPSISKQTFRAAVEASAKHNIRTVVHIKTWQDIRDAIEVGANAVTHVPKGIIPDDIPKLMAQSGIAIIPTLTVETDLTDFVFTPSVLKSRLAIAMTTQGIIQGYSNDKTLEKWSDREEKWRSADAEKMMSVQKKHKYGVKILVGTDSGNWGTIQGFSVHRELYKLTQAGLNAWQALAAATTEAGKFLGINYGFTEGSQASFVVLDASPIENILNTQKIHMVIHHGVVVNQDELLKQSFE